LEEAPAPKAKQVERVWEEIGSWDLSSEEEFIKGEIVRTAKENMTHHSPNISRENN
jgi:hypothetical protein